jgi:RimJ/RimL family protein N-acetyltransferase
MALLPEQIVRVQIPDTLAPIRTQRLLLRPLADSDADDLFAIRSRPEVARTKYVLTCTLRQGLD